MARVRSRKFPACPRDARAVLDELKLPHVEARKLFEDGWLSFDPADASLLNETQESELLFLGSMVATGCGQEMLSRMLADLEPPFAYDMRCLYYDFRVGRWRLFPFMSDPESAFFALLDHLDDAEEIQALRSVRAWVDEALELAHERQVFFDHVARRKMVEFAMRIAGGAEDRR